MKIAIACDHGGLELKDAVVASLGEWGHDVADLGVNDHGSVDYPDYALRVTRQVTSGEADLGVLVCGTGIGMSIAANKVSGIRAALAGDEFSARMARAHNDANVLCLGNRVVGFGAGVGIVRAWLEARFEGARHQRRLDKIAAIRADGSAATDGSAASDGSAVSDTDRADRADRADEGDHGAGAVRR
jgi:ribose 5-phosphate isomerase B